MPLPVHCAGLLRESPECPVATLMSHTVMGSHDFMLYNDDRKMMIMMMIREQ